MGCRVVRRKAQQVVGQQCMEAAASDAARVVIASAIATALITSTTGADRGSKLLRGQHVKSGHELRERQASIGHHQGGAAAVVVAATTAGTTASASGGGTGDGTTATPHWNALHWTP